MIYGVDVGVRRVAFACVQFGMAYSVDLGKKVGDRQHELKYLASWFADHVPETAVCWVEAPIQGGAGDVQTAVKIAMTVGALFSVDRPGAMSLVAPSSWKAAVVGHGHADKEQVREWVERACPQSSKACAGIEDRYDATAISRYGELVAAGRLGPKSSVPRSRTRGLLR